MSNIKILIQDLETFHDASSESNYNTGRSERHSASESINDTISSMSDDEIAEVIERLRDYPYLLQVSKELIDELDNNTNRDANLIRPKFWRRLRKAVGE